MQMIWHLVYNLTLVCPSTYLYIYDPDYLDGDKSTGSSRSQNQVDIFRGVSFSDWLKLIMQVKSFEVNLQNADVES